jgi:hypothetical protein
MLMFSRPESTCLDGKDDTHGSRSVVMIFGDVQKRGSSWLMSQVTGDGCSLGS